MKKLFENLFFYIAVPIVYLNVFSSLVAFVWLIILKKWYLVILIVLGLTSHMLLTFIMIPATLLILLAIKLFEKKQKFLGIVFCYLATLIDMFIIFCWVTIVYYFGVTQITSQSEILPIMLWANGVSIGPIYYMANKDNSEQLGTKILTFFITVGCFLHTILISFFGFSLIETSVIFLICMSICLNIMFYDAYERIKV